jgi:histone H3/H4
VYAAVQKASTWVADAWTAANMKAGTITRTISQDVQKASTWVADAWTAVNKAGDTVHRTLNQAVQKTSGKWNTDAWSAINKGKADIDRVIKQAVKKADKWNADAWSAINKGKADISRVIKQSVRKADKWSDTAWDAVNKGKADLARTITQAVKAGKWSDNAWAAAQKGKADLARTLKQIVKAGKWSDKAWEAAKMTGGTVTKVIKTTVQGVGDKAKAFFKWLTGKAEGGVYVHGHWTNLPQFAGGGIIKNGLQHFATGGWPSMGSLFVAGEAGPEIVGTINGRTEVLNKSQIASAIYSAVKSGMTESVNALGKYLNSSFINCTNGIISAIVTTNQSLVPAIANGNIIPYSMLNDISDSANSLRQILDILRNTNHLTNDELSSIIETVIRRYLNIQFYIGDEQIAKHANAGNELITRRFSPVMK